MILFYILIQMLIQVYSPKLNLPPPTSYSYIVQHLKGFLKEISLL